MVERKGEKGGLQRWKEEGEKCVVYRDGKEGGKMWLV